MKDTRIKISTLIENQVPQFLRESSPLLIDFLRQYYISIETKGSTIDVLENIDQYIKLDNVTNFVSNTKLSNNLSFFDEVVEVESTFGFPDSFGLIKINDEIITYESKTKKSFINCYRGFSGVESFGDSNFEKNAIFTKTSTSEHNKFDSVENLSVIFLSEFLIKLKRQFLPGFEDRELTKNLNENIFIKQSKDFYSTKGTIQSFKILFGALYGQKVDVIRPSEYLIKPSESSYLITRDLVVEPIDGNPEDLINQTIIQDEDEYFSFASGTVTKVESLLRQNKQYYILSLDYDYDKDIETRGSLVGEFKLHSKTRVIGNVTQNQDYIDVESTIGFPNSGSLVVNKNGIDFFIEYKSKTSNQFFECDTTAVLVIDDESKIIIEDESEIRLNTYAYGYSKVDQSEIRFRIGGVLSDLDVLDDTFLLDPGDSINIISPGKIVDDVRAKNWIYNISLSYDISSILPSGIVNTIDPHKFVLGDNIEIKPSDGSKLHNAQILKVNSKNQISINPPLTDIKTKISYTIIKKLSKCKFSNYPELSNLNSDIQNSYVDLDDNSLYVTSPSVPNYSNSTLNISDGSIILNGFQTNNQLVFVDSQNKLLDHPFITGDIIFYSYGDEGKNLNITEGVYKVKKINNNTIKLAKSNEDLFLNNFITFNPTEVKNNRLSFFNLSNKRLTSQKIVRKIDKPINSSTLYETKSGSTGILLNGVEILNYKSNDYIYYGPIENINAVSDLDVYDIINPNELNISDPNGDGKEASCNLHVTGNLKKINIVDPGFDYLRVPKVKIDGGNGKNAVVEVNLVNFKHLQEFNSNNASSIDIANNIINFDQDHRFRDIEEVIYDTYGNIPVGGLENQSPYTLKTLSSTQVQLYPTIEDADVGINTVQFTSLGSGVHNFTSIIDKKRIGSIKIINSGENFSNKKIEISPNNVNIKKNTIIAKNHGFKDGDIIEYYSSNQEIGGLSSGKYYIKYINDNEFSLSQINIDGDENFNFKSNIIINFSNTGTGVHYFNYPEIIVSVEGISGVNKFSNNNFPAKVQPIFRGKIDNIFITSSGKDYGTSEIINYERQPVFDLVVGDGATLKPIILNGRIEEVLILNSGNNYNSPPDIIINGSGKGATLTPIIENGRIIEVKVINKGVNYSANDTEIIVTPMSKTSKFSAKIKSWNINNYFRFLTSKILKENDAILNNPINENYGLQYLHYSLPQALRKILLTSKIFEDNLITISDYENDDRSENERIHSPIVGWAYDGNPIYGPYGFDTPQGGAVRIMNSSYRLSLFFNQTREKLKLVEYDSGFFVEDYIYSGNGDLDENNGRYCITPEFPNGTYAYFCTIEDREFKPVFPFIIGNYYRSVPIDFNFNKKSNQDEIDINEKNWVRNTEPYNLLFNNTNYNYLINPNKIKPQQAEITSTQRGFIDFIKILSPGVDYKVGEKIFLNSQDSNISDEVTIAEISEISGKKIIDILTNINTVDNVQFSKLKFSDRDVIGISSSPHGLDSGNYVTLCDCNQQELILDEKFYNVLVEPTKLVLRNSVGSLVETGTITYFDIYGDLRYPFVMEDDIFTIGEEQIKILNVDLHGNRIKVLRGYNSTLTSPHLVNQLLIENPRKFYLNLKLTENYKINRKYYFNPTESIGIGTTSGVGIGTTIFFSNPGIGLTQIFIPTKSIYLKDHELNTNDRLIYNSNSGTNIRVSNDGATEFILDNNSILYVAKITNDLIGISTSRVGLSTFGDFVSIDTSNEGPLYFNSLGLGNNHVFIADYENNFRARVSNIVSKVSLNENSNLKLKDNINLDVNSVGISTYKMFYDFNSRNLIFDKKKIEFISDINNTFTILNHNFKRGQKVLFNSFLPPIGLVDGGKYYAIPINNNTIKISNTYYGSLNNTDIVNINLQFQYTPDTNPFFFSLVNPPLEIYTSNTVLFDLSDTSLDGFDFNIYEDKNYNNIFYQFSGGFNVVKNSICGRPNASLILTTDTMFTARLYYNLTIPNKDRIFFEKLQYFADDFNIPENNTLIFKKSLYSDNHSITGIGTNYFEFNLRQTPENLIYINDINSIINYRTKSKNTLGPISNIKLNSIRRNYKKLPKLTKIDSKKGKNALLEPRTSTIGKISNIRIKDIGFDYSTDKTLRSSAKIPEILKIDPLSSLESIKVVSFGENYIFPPNLVVIDNFNQKIVSDVELDFKLNDTNVNIIRNTKGINNIIPRIVPTNNSNGTKIRTITYDSFNKKIIVFLDIGYSFISDFPFKIGDSILIEYTKIISNTGKSYNSLDYNYNLFKIIELFPQIGGEDPRIVLDVSDFVSKNETFGVYDEQESSGIVVIDRYFPTFNITLQKNIFLRGETVKSGNSFGVVEYWDESNGFLKVNTNQNFILNSKITGESSSSIGIIIDRFSFNSVYVTDSTSIVDKSWQNRYGFLNDDLQRIHDNNYYQYFSYSLKSNVQYNEWNNAVSSLNHTSGFKKFSNLDIELKEPKFFDFDGKENEYIGIETSQNNGNFTSIVQLDSKLDINCKNDYDLVSENSNIFGNDLMSDQIYFESKELVDYFNCIGNKVLSIDDISDQFRNEERLNVVNRFKI